MTIRRINENVNLDLKLKYVYCWFKIIKTSNIHEQYLWYYLKGQISVKFFLLKLILI